ncbi:armadillo repeat-containing protein 6 [Aplysia californica]|uniref:Armadillo repeat-containing protein 6 n=1 Tax=Aplysia californica TaxID=6500 RepID=A0ABM0JBC7_APLCA|nr:armadillo repeat-containing protein 6 [Aplysia californica]
MAKQISQKTFDDVVRENMREFEMEAEEAVQDAIQQFESQGVNLSIIVKDPSLYTESADSGDTHDHPVVTAVKKLDACLAGPPGAAQDEIVSCLQDVQKECDTDLSRRCLAGSNGAYDVLYKALCTYEKEPDTFRLVLSSFCALVNGQPDLIDCKGIELLMSALKQYRESAETEELIVRAIRLNCVKHEANRQEFVKHDYIITATELLTAHKSNPTLVKEICISLRTLTLDDDVRVPFGKAHETAKTIVTEGDALKAILSLCEEHLNNPIVLAELFLTLSCLAVRNEFCEEVMNRGGLKLIIQAFESGIKDKVIVRQALIVMKVLAGNDDVKKEICKLGGVELVVTAMTTHQNNSHIAEAACKLLTAITLRNPENCRKVVDCHGHQHIVQAMKLHPNEVGVQKNACMSLRNLVSRTKDLSECILALGVEPLLNNAMNCHKEAQDEAKAALRDLGCKVELQELWKGKRGTLQ